jgi:hypothetical protein
MWFYIFQGIGYGFAPAVQPGLFRTYLISQTLMKSPKLNRALLEIALIALFGFWRYRL